MLVGLTLQPKSLDFADHVAAAKAAERAGIDFLLVPDLAAGAMKHEAFALLAALSAVTTQIGLVATASLDFNDPYNLARALATLDHLSGGRAGWRAVTGISADEARNFGLDDIAPKTARLARAEELLDLVGGLLDSWDDGAIPRDKTSGIFFDRAGMRLVAHKGAHFRVRGPLDIPTAPQRHLPVFCDLRSPDDLDFVSRHADVACVDDAAMAAALTDRLSQRGRPRAAVKILLRLDSAASAEIATADIDGVILNAAAPDTIVAEKPAHAGTLRTRLGLPPAPSRHQTIQETTDA
jgi:alkanesulfonate monooxygenase SsuD/methylene tetrahydromethanopterin reductase-like flavin-dependent oxidoreductase (luciferase family)